MDHPLCAECTHLLLTTLTRQLDETKKERDGYIAFEKEVKKEKEREKDGLTLQEAEKRIAKLAQEEKLVVAQLKEAEKEREQLETELKALELEEKTLEEEEAEFVTLSLITIRSANRRVGFGEHIIHNSFEPLNRPPNSLRSGLHMLLIPLL